MKKSRVLIVIFCALGTVGVGQGQPAMSGQHAQARGGEVRWSFDAGSDGALQQSLAKSGDELKGYWRIVPGVSGQALEFDGYTTGITREGKDVPSLGDAFTVSAWVALNNYPWNWVPIIDQSAFQQVGFSLGIDAFGHLGLGASFDGVWTHVVSAETLPLKKWVHVTGTFHRGAGMTILIDGKPVGHMETAGSFWQARNASLVIGRVREPIHSFPAWISHPQDLIEYSLDGDLDEVTLLDHAISEDEDRAQIAIVAKPAGEVIPWAVLPTGPPGAGPFGAIYASLRFAPSWDRMRRLGPETDVVVRFDKSPMRLVFWQGSTISRHG
jgi:hypothetical protein